MLRTPTGTDYSTPRIDTKNLIDGKQLLALVAGMTDQGLELQKRSLNIS